MLNWAFSDTHIGISSNYDRLHKFLDMVERVRPDHLLAVGDIVELIWSDWESIYNWPPAIEAIKHLRAVAYQVKTILIKGNHDRRLDEVDALVLAPITIAQEPVILDGVLYTHGHEYDPVERFLWKWLCRSPLRMLAPKIYRDVRGSPYQEKRSGELGSYYTSVGLVEMGITKYALTNNQSIVFGHTHMPYMRRARGVRMANTGDFVDSCSYVVSMDGKLWLEWV